MIDSLIYNQFENFCKTASLFKNSFYELELFDLEDVCDDINIDNLQIDINENLENIPLGKRVEYFFDAIIQQSPNHEKVLKNKQIIHNKLTLGEIDFILYNKKRKLYQHIEIQYKFYLYDHSIKDEISRYVGPSKNDSLILKLEKLKNKQFPLLFKEETKEYLKSVDLR
ncbi:MAG: DUF1853 family protein, partial [Poseidonibacter sp.]|uniref:DUF1853 family protein n=1 Tax=Poseidonibacter sp. TaxID=2321188 RepID=UPI00359D68FF